MNAQTQSQLDHLEGTLNTLIASISAYNPSPTAATSVLEADDELSDCLEQLTQHQRNFQVIQQLRTTSESLDERIKANLSSLVDVRTELIKHTPVSFPPSDNKPSTIDADELLKFAQLIARAPASRPSDVATSQETETKGAIQSVGPSIKEERVTPQPPASFDTIMTNSEHQPSALQNSTQQGVGKAVSSLGPELRAWLEPPISQEASLPWTTEDIARKGMLYQFESSLIKSDKSATED